MWMTSKDCPPIASKTLTQVTLTLALVSSIAPVVWESVLGRKVVPADDTTGAQVNTSADFTGGALIRGARGTNRTTLISPIEKLRIGYDSEHV
jgi:hypothetical protein